MNENENLSPEALYQLAIESLRDIASLEEDWFRKQCDYDLDSHPISPGVIKHAVMLLHHIKEHNMLIPKFYAGLEGRIQIDWSSIIINDSSHDIIIDVTADGRELRGEVLHITSEPEYEFFTQPLGENEITNINSYHEMLSWVERKFKEGVQSS